MASISESRVQTEKARPSATSSWHEDTPGKLRHSQTQDKTVALPEYRSGAGNTPGHRQSDGIHRKPDPAFGTH